MTERKQLNRDEADRLLERYYDGATSNEEERLLRAFLASKEANDKLYDADKAVMGLFCTQRAKQRRAIHWNKPALAAIAAIIILVVSLWHFVPEPSSDCIAYIHGEEYTNQELVMEQMQQTMQSVTVDHTTQRMEEQMKCVFN